MHASQVSLVGSLTRTVVRRNAALAPGIATPLPLASRQRDRGLRGLFAGVAAEYLSSRIENSTDQIATNARLIVPEIEFGYRYALGSLFLGGVAGVGYAFEVDSSVENLPGGTRAQLFEVEDASTVYGSAGLEIGLYF